MRTTPRLLLALLACATALTARAQGEDPDPIVVSAPSYALAVPGTHLHPGTQFDLVVYVTNDGERAVRVWSEDIATTVTTHSGGYVTVVAGPTSAELAELVPAKSAEYAVVFTLVTYPHLPHEVTPSSWESLFTLRVEGVLP